MAAIPRQLSLPPACQFSTTVMGNLGSLCNLESLQARMPSICFTFALHAQGTRTLALCAAGGPATTRLMV